MTKQLKIIFIAFGTAIVAGAVWFYTASGHSSGLLKYVPDNTFCLMKLNVPEFASILNKHQNELKRMAFLNDREFNAHEPLLKVLQTCLNKPEDCGIHWGKEILFYAAQDKRGMAMGLLFELKDKEKFAAIVKNQVTAGGQSGEFEGIGYGEFGTGTYISWKGNVGFLSFNPASNRDYIATVLNKSTHLNSKLFDRVVSEKELISGGLLLDPVFELLENEQPGSVRNPFEAGSSLYFSGMMSMEKLRQKIELISPEKSKSKGIFKKKGQYGALRKQLFTRNKPLYALNLSFEPDSLMSFFSRIAPDGSSGIASGMAGAVLSSVWNGEVCMGVSANNNDLDNLLNEGIFNQPQNMLSSFGIVVHLGIKKGAEGMVNDYTKMAADMGHGVKKLGEGDIYFVHKNKEIIISNELNTLINYGKNTSANPMKDEVGKADAPIYFAMNAEEIITQNQLQMMGLSSSLIRLFESFRSRQYIWLEGKTLYSETRLIDLKTHPLILMLRALEEIYQQEKNGIDPIRDKSVQLPHNHRIPTS